MTTLTLAHAESGLTTMDRMLLRTAAAIDAYVITRAARRARTNGRRQYRRMVTDEQRDRAAGFAARLLP